MLFWQVDVGRLVTPSGIRYQAMETYPLDVIQNFDSLDLVVHDSTSSSERSAELFVWCETDGACSVLVFSDFPSVDEGEVTARDKGQQQKAMEVRRTQEVDRLNTKLKNLTHRATNLAQNLRSFDRAIRVQAAADYKRPAIPKHVSQLRLKIKEIKAAKAFLRDVDVFFTLRLL